MRYHGRKGITLLEVLVSIFIMGVGMIALLTLFPLGALSMAQALQNDRAAQAANQAAEMAIARNLRRDLALFGGVGGAPFTASDPFINPVPGAWPALQQVGSPEPRRYSKGASFPVLVDPYGVTLGSAYLGQVSNPPPAGSGLTATAGIPRRAVSYAPTLQAINRWFGVQDDITFSDSAVPTAQPIQKGGRYTWSYLLRRPRAFSDELVDLWVIVYAGRDTQTSPPQGETVYPVSTSRSTSPNTVQVTYGVAGAQDKPATRKGTWILDVTADANGVTQGNFYRVVNATDSGANQVILEVDPPLKADMTVAVVMENVIDVFEKGSSWLP